MGFIKASDSVGVETEYRVVGERKEKQKKKQKDIVVVNIRSDSNSLKSSYYHDALKCDSSGEVRCWYHPLK